MKNGIILRLLLSFLLLMTAAGSAAHAQIQEDNLAATPLPYSDADMQTMIEKDTSALQIVKIEPSNLVPYAIVYPDKGSMLDVASIVTRYARDDRPRPMDGRLLAITPTPGVTTYWVVIPIRNQTDQTRWTIDFGNRLAGRSMRLTSIYVAGTNEPAPYFRAAASPLPKSATLAKTDIVQRSIPVDLRARTYQLVVMRLVVNPSTPMIMPIQIGPDSMQIPARLPWQSGWIFTLTAALLAGGLLSLAFVSQRYEPVLLALYIISLRAQVSLDKPLIRDASIDDIFTPETSIIFQVLALCLVIWTIGRLSGSGYIRPIVAGITALMGSILFAALVMTPPAMHGNMVILFIITLPLIIAAVTLAIMQVLDRNVIGIYSVGLCGIHIFALTLQMLSEAQFIAPHPVLMNIMPMTLFISGPLLFYILQRVNLFAEIAETGRRRKLSPQEVETYGKIRYAKENFDYNSLLKVIEHERRQLAAARVRENVRGEEMRKAKEAADEANRAKSAFLAVISHEIRTPMTGVLGMVKLLMDTTLTKSQHDYVVTIKESGDAMMSLLNDILDFEKIETGKMQLEELDFDLHRLISGVATLMNGHAAGKGIYLKTDIEDGTPQFVIGDMMRLRQILLNLTGNAIKFTKDGGVTIHISASAGQQDENNRTTYQVYFGIEDTGIGIPVAAQRNIFTPFSQADKSIARKFGGSGLGLAISNRLVEAMGSQINIKSRESEGTTFFFSIQMTEGDPELVEEPALGRSLNILSSKESGGVQAEGDRLRILVVEDNSITQRVLRSLIEQKQHNVTLAQSGEEALRLITDKNKFDLIFTDILMDGMTGHELARAIRDMTDQTMREMPIIALTGNVQEADIEECYAAGMNGHLAKPIDPDMFDKILLDYATHQLKPVYIAPRPAAKPKRESLTAIDAGPSGLTPVQQLQRIAEGEGRRQET